MTYQNFADMLVELGKTQKLPTGISADFVFASLVADYGFPAKISEAAHNSLKTYTWNTRELGLNAVLGPRIDQFQAFIDIFALGHDSILQPTTAGKYKKIGSRRLLFDSIAFAYGDMSRDAFYEHVNAAAHNGEIYARTQKTTGMKWLASGLPASFPPVYPGLLAEFMNEKWAKK